MTTRSSSCGDDANTTTSSRSSCVPVCRISRTRSSRLWASRVSTKWPRKAAETDECVPRRDSLTAIAAGGGRREHPMRAEGRRRRASEWEGRSGRAHRERGTQSEGGHRESGGHSASGDVGENETEGSLRADAAWAGREQGPSWQRERVQRAESELESGHRAPARRGPGADASRWRGHNRTIASVQPTFCPRPHTQSSSGPWRTSVSHSSWHVAA